MVCKTWRRLGTEIGQGDPRTPPPRFLERGLAALAVVLQRPPGLPLSPAPVAEGVTQPLRRAAKGPRQERSPSPGRTPEKSEEKSVSPEEESKNKAREPSPVPAKKSKKEKKAKKRESKRSQSRVPKERKESKAARRSSPDTFIPVKEEESGTDKEEQPRLKSLEERAAPEEKESKEDKETEGS